MSRQNPKNRQEAFAYQFQDCAKTLMPLALQENEKGFDQQISVIEVFIKSYRSKRLRNECEKTEKKSKENRASMEKKFPSFYDDKILRSGNMVTLIVKKCYGEIEKGEYVLLLCKELIKNIKDIHPDKGYIREATTKEKKAWYEKTEGKSNEYIMVKIK